VKAYSSPSFFWLFTFQKDRSFYHLIRRCKTHINPSRPATPQEKKKQKKKALSFSLSFSLRECFFLSFCNGF
jgi:hypothetical protein